MRLERGAWKRWEERRPEVLLAIYVCVCVCVFTCWREDIGHFFQSGFANSGTSLQIDGQLYGFSFSPLLRRMFASFQDQANSLQLMRGCFLTFWQNTELLFVLTWSLDSELNFRYIKKSGSVDCALNMRRNHRKLPFWKNATEDMPWLSGCF